MLGLKLNHVSKRGHWSLQHLPGANEWILTWSPGQHQLLSSTTSHPLPHLLHPSHSLCIHPSYSTYSPLTHRGRDKMAAIFQYIFLNENVWISIKISLKFVVPKGLINNIPAMAQITAWRRLGNKPLSEPMVVRLQRIYAPLGLNELTPSHGLKSMF